MVIQSDSDSDFLDNKAPALEKKKETKTDDIWQPLPKNPFARYANNLYFFGGHSFTYSVISVYGLSLVPTRRHGVR